MHVGFRNVVQGYGRRRILDDLTLELQPGVTALLGPNAAGKSTLMRTLVTDLAPRSGEVVIGGEVMSSGAARQRGREQIGYLPQNFGFEPRFTVSEHVEYLAWLRGVPGPRRDKAVSDAIQFVDLADRRRTRMKALSGGSRQRAGIAGAIVGSPDVLVLDEPTVGLDPAQRASFRALVSRLQASHILLSTHLTDDVEAVAEHLLVLANGKMLRNETVAHFVSRHGGVEKGYLEAVASKEELKR